MPPSHGGIGPRGWGGGAVAFARLLVLVFLALPQVLARCPASSTDILSLNPWTSCVITATINMSPEEITEYFRSSKPQSCVDTKRACVKAGEFGDCSTQTQDALLYIVPPSGQNDSLVQCVNVFRGLTQYCDRPFSELIGVYCPPPLLLPISAIIGIVVGSIVLLLFVLYVFYRMKRSLALEREIEDAVMRFRQPPDGSALASHNPTMILPPSSAAAGGGGAGKGRRKPTSQYIGVEWNDRSGGWDAYYTSDGGKEWLGTYETEEQAAQRYDAKVRELRQTGMTRAPLNFPVVASTHIQLGVPSPPPPPPPPQQQPTQSMRPVLASRAYEDPAVRARHIQELIEFYQYYDGDRPDIEAHVIDLFERYDFKGIAKAILRKYGILPAQWQYEYDAQRSIAVSMAHRLFPSNSQSSHRLMSASGDHAASSSHQPVSSSHSEPPQYPNVVAQTRRPPPRKEVVPDF